MMPVIKICRTEFWRATALLSTSSCAIISSRCSPRFCISKQYNASFRRTALQSICNGYTGDMTMALFVVLALLVILAIIALTAMFSDARDIDDEALDRAQKLSPK